jgi:hypothetical protein
LKTILNKEERNIAKKSKRKARIIEINTAVQQQEEEKATIGEQTKASL